MSANAKKRPARFRHCTSACTSGGHPSWGACVRAKNLNLNPNLSETHIQKAWDREIDSYKSARAQGVQPAGTKQHQIDAAMQISEQTGAAFQA